MYSMCQSNAKCRRYHSFKKSDPNHRSLTLKHAITFITPFLRPFKTLNQKNVQI